MTIAEKLNSIDSSILSEDLISDQIISSHQYKELYDQLDNQLTLLYEKENSYTGGSGNTAVYSSCDVSSCLDGKLQQYLR